MPATAQPFNADFYVAAVTLIPIFFVAVAVDQRLLGDSQELMRREWTVQHRRAERKKGRATRIDVVAAFLLMFAFSAVAGSVAFGAVGEICGVLALHTSHATQFEAVWTFNGAIALPSSAFVWNDLVFFDRQMLEPNRMIRRTGLLLPEIADLTRRANELEREITALVREVAPSLLALPGCGALSAAKIVGEAAGASRFKSKAAFARWNGTAPIPVWSGSTNFRLNRGGNRQVNAALHRIAVTQARGIGTGRDYLDMRTTRGDSKKEALRMLRRRLSDEVFRRLLLNESLPVAAEFPLAA